MNSYRAIEPVSGQVGRLRLLVSALALLNLMGCGGEDGGELSSVVQRPVRSCLADPACDATVIVAHRGVRGPGIPENSLAAIRATANAGIPVVELDIRHTQDGQLVLMHDPTISRTTGVQGKVEEFTWEELSGLELVGSNPDDPESSRVPLFAEALELSLELGLSIYLDMKTSRVDLVAEEILAQSAQDFVLIRKDVESLEGFLALNAGFWPMPSVKTAAEAAEAKQRLPGLDIVEIGALSPQADLSAEIIGMGLTLQQDVMVSGDLQFTLDGSSSGWLGYINAGVRVLQSDKPAELLEWLKAEQRPVIALCKQSAG